MHHLLIKKERTFFQKTGGCASRASRTPTVEGCRARTIRCSPTERDASGSRGEARRKRNSDRRTRRMRAAPGRRRGMAEDGLFDLGDVRLSALEPFVHGHVEDPLGARVASAYVQLGIQHTGSFEHVEYLVSTGPTDKSGEFALYLPRIDANLVLMATTEGGRFRLHPASQAVVLDPPGIEQVLRLEALGEIDGTLLIDDASQSNLVQLRLSNVPVYPERTVVGHELRFRFEGVPVGSTSSPPSFPSRISARRRIS